MLFTHLLYCPAGLGTQEADRRGVGRRQETERSASAASMGRRNEGLPSSLEPPLASPQYFMTEISRKNKSARASRCEELGESLSVVPKSRYTVSVANSETA